MVQVAKFDGVDVDAGGRLGWYRRIWGVDVSQSMKRILT